MRGDKEKEFLELGLFVGFKRWNDDTNTCMEGSRYVHERYL